MFRDLNPENLDLAEVFLLADRIHQWIANHPEESFKLEVNYLDLSCLGSRDGWAATFDCLAFGEGEWFDHIEDYQFAAKAESPERAIYRAAIKVREAIRRL